MGLLAKQCLFTVFHKGRLLCQLAVLRDSARPRRIGIISLEPINASGGEDCDGRVLGDGHTCGKTGILRTRHGIKRQLQTSLCRVLQAAGVRTLNFGAPVIETCRNTY